MKFQSTRGQKTNVNMSEAILQGLAPDGGLFYPELIPQKEKDIFLQDMSLADYAAQLLSPYFADDPLQKDLMTICQEAFNFPIILKSLNTNISVLELFHGPTCAFKDFGARFLAACLRRLDSKKKKVILVATSGDTGGAVAAAFAGVPNVEVGVLYPKGMVSERQKKQLTSWGSNIYAYSVSGTFDDCQALVKSAFADSSWPDRQNLTSANSINIGRLLPQIAYFAFASEKFISETNKKPGLIIPTGNLGNAVGAFYARAMGSPIAKIVIATNANQTISDYYKTKKWQPRPSVQTLANAMDVGNPSNIERLFKLYPNASDLLIASSAHAVSDEEIKQTIKSSFKKWNTVFCPHTATGISTCDKVGGGPWIVASTAHPSKFETIVEPIIGQPIELPRALAEILKKPEKFVEIDSTFKSFKAAWIAR